MTVETIIERCNQFIWGHMHTPDFPLDFQSAQHRDLVRTFFAGWLECLMAHPNTEEARELGRPLMGLYATMTAVDWVPDVRFERPSN